MAWGSLPLGLKWPCREFTASPLSSPQGNMSVAVTSFPLYALMTRSGTTLIFFSSIFYPTLRGLQVWIPALTSNLHRELKAGMTCR